MAAGLGTFCLTLSQELTWMVLYLENSAIEAKKAWGRSCAKRGLATEIIGEKGDSDRGHLMKQHLHTVLLFLVMLHTAVYLLLSQGLQSEGVQTENFSVLKIKT